MTMSERMLAAFKMIGSGTYKDVVEYLQVKKPKQVLRRMGNLVKRSLIKNTGERKGTSRGKTSAIYILADDTKTDKEAKSNIKTKKKVMQADNISTPSKQGELFS